MTEEKINEQETEEELGAYYLTDDPDDDSKYATYVNPDAAEHYDRADSCSEDRPVLTDLEDMLTPDELIKYSVMYQKVMDGELDIDDLDIIDMIVIGKMLRDEVEELESLEDSDDPGYF